MPSNCTSRVQFMCLVRDCSLQEMKGEKMGHSNTRHSRRNISSKKNCWKYDVERKSTYVTGILVLHKYTKYPFYKYFIYIFHVMYYKDGYWGVQENPTSSYLVLYWWYSLIIHICTSSLPMSLISIFLFSWTFWICIS